MAKRRRSPASGGSAPAKPAGRWPRSDIKHTSVYLPEAAYEALRQVAFDERRKIHDLLIEGVELALKKRGYPALADMKAKWQRKERSGSTGRRRKSRSLVTLRHFYHSRRKTTVARGQGLDRVPHRNRLGVLAFLLSAIEE